MKTRYIILFAGLILLTACKKEKIDLTTSATITVINAITDGSPLKVNPTGNPITYKNTTEQVAVLGRGFYFAPAGLTNISAVLASDTTKNIFTRAITVEPKVYNLYLFGRVNAVETMLVEEPSFPLIKTDINTPAAADSVVNIRFVNLSSASNPTLKIKLSIGSAYDVENLPFKSISAWKAYPAKGTSTVYSFQIKDAATDALITTYNFSTTTTNRFRNVALIIKGTVGGTGADAFSLFAVNYF